MKLFSNISETFFNPHFRNMIIYLFISIFALVYFTNPSFGFDLLNTKMLNRVSNFANTYGNSSIFDTIGLGYNELYFYLGYIIIYSILLLYAMYKRIDKCIVEYRKKNVKYASYSPIDFYINNASDVLYDAFIKTIKTLIAPFLIFIIITIIYLLINNFAKVAVPIKIITAVIHYGRYLIYPIVNICLFIFYFLIIDSATEC